MSTDKYFASIAKYEEYRNKGLSLYLMQRATINSPLADPDTLLSKAVQFHYMGAAEYEFGAYHDTLGFMRAYKDKLTLRKVPSIMEGEHCLRVYSYMDDDVFARYVWALERHRKGDTMYNIKMGSRFEENYKHPSYEVTNFWVDESNHAMFSFHKQFMNRLPSYLNASFKVVK